MDSAVLHKRVLGVPVIYLAGGFVAILAVYALKTKNTGAIDALTESGATDATDPTADPNAQDTILASGDVFPTMPSGSITGTPLQSGPGINSSLENNDDWIKAGVAYLGEAGISPGASQLALQTYLNGDMLTFDQGAMRDRVVKQLGLPPTITPIGSTQPKPSMSHPPIPVKPTKPPIVKPPTRSNTPKAVAHAPVSVPKYPGLNGGANSANVKRIQAKVGAKEDGSYGPKTTASVRAWQSKHGLKADGEVGPLTWAKMFG